MNPCRSCPRTICTIAQAAPSQEVTTHLQDLLARSSEELTEGQRSQLTKLLTEFQDVFARSEFNFGDFAALVHEIDILYRKGVSAPVLVRQ